MSTTRDAGRLLSYPFARSNPIDPSPELARVRAEAPVEKVRLRAGGEAWLVTGYEEVKRLLGDPAFGTQFPGAMPSDDPDDLSGGFLFLKDPPEHTRLRRSVSRAFTARRVADLRERARGVAERLVAQMRHAGPVADLQDAFSFPLPIAVISELLGVPDADRERFRRWSDIVLRTTDAPAEATATAFPDLQRFVVGLVDAKPDGPDLLSELVSASGSDQGLTRREVCSMAIGLLMAGYVTTALAITVGTLRLLLNPELFAALRDGDVQVGALVEELLRYQDEELGIQRVAHRDVDFNGTHIRAGEMVIASRVGANRDPRQFPRPERLEPTRASASHLTFGHGAHHCLGAALARMELEVAFSTLATTLPTLRLAVDFEEIEWRNDGMDVSLKALPVTW